MWGTRPLPSGEPAVEAPAAVMYVQYVYLLTLLLGITRGNPLHGRLVHTSERRAGRGGTCRRYVHTIGP